MTTIVLIGGDAALRLQVRRAMQPDWSALEAADGLSGLEQVRRAGQAVTLVVLDLDLPDLDGRLVCAQLRALLPTVPILPLTTRLDQGALLAELACLTPLAKPFDEQELAVRLCDAVGQTAAPRESALLRFVQVQAAEAERQARLGRRREKIAVFARDLVTRIGLAQMVAAARPGATLTSIAALEELEAAALADHTVVVAHSADYVPAAAVLRRLDVPLLVLGTTIEAVQPARDDGYTSAVLADAPEQTVRRLAVALQQIQRGERVVPLEAGPLAAPAMPPGPLPGLSPRETEVVVLDLHGWSTPSIAERLGVEPLTVTTYWKRIYRKLEQDRPGVRQWAAALLLRGTDTPLRARTLGAADDTSPL